MKSKHLVGDVIDKSCMMKVWPEYVSMVPARQVPLFRRRRGETEVALSAVIGLELFLTLRQKNMNDGTCLYVELSNKNAGSRSAMLSLSRKMISLKDEV